MKLTRLVSAVLPLLIAPVMAVAVAQPAAAAPARPTGGCSGDRTFAKKYDDTVKFRKANGTYAAASGDAGVTLSLSTTRSYTVTGSAQLSGNISVKIVAATVGVGASFAYTATSSSSGAWTVPQSYKHGGELQIGARVHSGTVKRFLENKSCKIIQIGYASYKNLPESHWHFHHIKYSH